MPRITVDPTKETCPDYALPEHAPIRALLATGTTTHAEAGDLLKALWTAKNDKDKLAWESQAVFDAAERLARLQQHEAETTAQEEAAQLERDTLYKEERKRNKDKYTAVALDRGVPMQPVETIATYALQKLKKGHYVELWFLTNDGLDSARRGHLHHSEQSAMVVTQGPDGTATLEPAIQVPRGIVDDEDLPWEDFVTACPLLIKAAEDNLWTTERIDMMSGLFFAVQTHPWRRSRDALERRSLQVYAAEQRRHWHAALPGGAYNISIFNEALLQHTNDRLYREERKNLDGAARVAIMYVP
ncbi:hypothetical protein FIBSPDRAFT_720150 [Athelia psychrophila]|uniref:Uncharacterized protein n=1 Tax=Athelia psychrophila TaxID=1759441 RepID=A0A166WFZ0_9AGAM|nr:hypothetical protein FIBSPDRAFT_720150 [Fibularhizoctonia sp. CBS 109695]